MSGGYNIEARMAQVNGQPQRIAPILEEDLTPEALEISIALRKAFGIPENGTVPEVFRTMLVHPGLFRANMEVGIELALRPAVPARDREIGVLRNAWLLGAPYEWGEHVDMGKRFGVSEEEVERTKVGSAAPEWNDHERAICKAVEELRDDAMIADATWATLMQTWDGKQMMEFLNIIGEYTQTAYVQNSLRLNLAATNPGLGHR
jgi:4-carboxymuconolactone decarboxylase